MPVFLLSILALSLISGCIGSNDEALAEKTAQIEDLVDSACTMIEAQGPQFFPELRDDSGEWYQGDTYIFVWQTDGLRVVYPPDTNMEGVDMSGLVDKDGKPIGALFIEIATKDPYNGWLDYMWPKPGSDDPEEKRTYIKRAVYEDTIYLVGSGFYYSDYG